MCSTCDYRKYIVYNPTENTEGKIADRIAENRKRLDNQYLFMNCNLDGHDFKIGEFRIYRCPTCGRML